MSLSAEVAKAVARMPQLGAAVAARLAPAVSDMARAAFDARQTVYGNARPKDVSLVRSGKLRALAVRYTATGAKIKAALAVPYARYHIKLGILPRAGNIPEKWDAQIRQMAKSEFERLVGGGS